MRHTCPSYSVAPSAACIAIFIIDLQRGTRDPCAMRVLLACVLLGCAPAPASPPPLAAPVAPDPAPSPTFSSAAASAAPATSEPDWITPDRIAAGKELFASNCSPCHGADAQGLIGPNLTDPAWIHGGKPASILRTIRNGWASKGMPAWKPTLSDEKTLSVAAFVVSIRNTNVAGGKPAQGIVDP